MRGSVQRVTFYGKTACLDGNLLPSEPLGQDMSTHGAMPMSPPLKPTVQSLNKVIESPRDRRSSMFAAGPAKLRSTDTAGQLKSLEELGSPMVLQPALGSQLQDLIAQPSSWRHQNVLSVTQYTRSDLHHLFTVAQEMRRGVQREGVLNLLRGRLLCTLFYEPSTRTSASFDAAMQRLGGRTVVISTSHSSVQKGETLQDTLRTLGCYGDAVVLRHPEESSVDVARKYASVPVINGGNGSKEHPTQAFLDLFTIREELGTVQNITITFIACVA
ncbi:Protein pyrABCN like protein [Verticillium longisporum]|nr:Protein pyrABCN like protein [Verticillium longisporum]